MNRTITRNLTAAIGAAGIALTRAGQIGAATNQPSGGAPMTCRPAASHG